MSQETEIENKIIQVKRDVILRRAMQSQYHSFKTARQSWSSDWLERSINSAQEDNSKEIL